MSDPAVDHLVRAKRHFDRVAEGEDVPSGLQQGLARVLKVTLDEIDTSGVTLGLIESLVLSMQGALQPAVEFYADSLPPIIVELGLRSAGGLVRTFGEPVDEWPASTRDNYPDWLDHALCLIAETEAARHRLRIAARAQARIAEQQAAATAGRLTLH